MQTLIRAVVIAALTLAKGPPWISIELPVNPYDQSQRGTFLLVHSFHHGTAMGYIVTGTAEGIVKGERRTVKLEFSGTTREGVYALRQTWPNEGTWTLVIKANQGPDDAATAVVDLGPDGDATRAVDRAGAGVAGRCRRGVAGPGWSAGATVVTLPRRPRRARRSGPSPHVSLTCL